MMKTTTCGITARIGVCGLLAMLTFASAYLTWQWYRTKVSAKAFRAQFVSSLAESLSQAPSTHIRVAVYDCENGGDGAARNIVKILDCEPNCTWQAISSARICAGDLRLFDVVVFPGGNAKQQATALGTAGRQVVRQFVSDGGGFIGVCAGAFFATCYTDWSLGLVDAKALTGDVYVAGQGIMSMSARSPGVVQMEVTRAGKQLFVGTAEMVDVQYSGGPILSPAERNGLSDYVTLAEYRTEVWDFDAQRGTMKGTPAIVASRYGNGNVIIVSPHIDMTSGLEALLTQIIYSVCHAERRSDSRSD